MTDTADAPDVISPPRTIVLAFALTIAHVVLSIANSAMLWGFQDYLRRQLVKSNDKAKAKDKKTDFNLDTPKGLHNVNHDLHSGLNVGLIQIAVFGLLVMLLAVNFRKGRGWARWAEILVLVIVVQAPFRLLNLGGDAPVMMRGVSALVGLTGLAIIVLLVVPESSRYFAAVRGVRPGDRASGAASMGFRGLFGPRPQPRGADDASAKTPARTTFARGGTARAGSARSGSAQSGSANARSTKAIEPPADKTNAVRTGKAKARAGTETASNPSRPSVSVASKNRGKSRKGS